MSKSPEDALDDFLDLLRREFRSDPELAHRAVKALGVKVVLRGSKAADVLNAMELVDKEGEEAARSTLISFSSAELKKIAKNNNLASPTDMKAKSDEDLVELILRRAVQKISERRHT